MVKDELTDDELDDFVENELKKDITQEDTIDQNTVEQQLGSMGFLWDRVQEKLQNDGICFSCGKNIEISGEEMHVLEASNVDKGVVAFVGVCPSCKKEQESKEND